MTDTIQMIVFVAKYGGNLFGTSCSRRLTVHNNLALGDINIYFFLRGSGNESCNLIGS